VKDVVELMHKKRVEGVPTLQTIVGDLKNNYSTELSIQDVCKWAQNNQSILSPIIILQLKFRRQLLGEKYWQAASEARFADPQKGSISFIKELFTLMQTKSAEVRQQKTMKAQKRNANFTVAQTNIARKQSILLSTFGLNQSPPQLTRKSSSRQMGLDANVNSDIKVKSKPTSSSSLLDPSPKKNAAAANGAVVPTNIMSTSGSNNKSNKNLNYNNGSNNSSPKISKNSKKLILDTPKTGESKEDEDHKGNINRDSSMATLSMSSKARPQSAKQSKKASKSRSEKNGNSSPDSPSAPIGGSPVVSRPKSAVAKSSSRKNLSREDSKASIKSSNGRKSSITT
jgi:hypothetical protein